MRTRSRSRHVYGSLLPHVHCSLLQLTTGYLGSRRGVLPVHSRFLLQIKRTLRSVARAIRGPAGLRASSRTPVRTRFRLLHVCCRLLQLTTTRLLQFTTVYYYTLTTLCYRIVGTRCGLLPVHSRCLLQLNRTLRFLLPVFTTG